MNADNEDRVPVSCRVRSSVKAKLEKARKNGDKNLTFGRLVENVLEDYVKYLADEGKV